jgi:hypothetical protein
MPVSDEDSAGDLDLNLFACKSDRAASLAASGMLITEPVHPRAALGTGIAFWRQHAFAANFGGGIAATDSRYQSALDLYAFWRDESRTPAERYGALRASVVQLEACCGERPARLATFARAAIEAAQPRLAGPALATLLNILQARGTFVIDEPFWPPAARFDRIASDDPSWFGAAVVEAFEQINAYSGYFIPPTTLPLLDWLQSTRFATPEMERRRWLKGQKAGRSEVQAQST